MSELLISATNVNTQQKGEVVDVKDSGHVWGGMEQPPDYVHVTITDADRPSSTKRHRPWLTTYTHELQSENPQRYRFRVRASDTSVAASGEGAEQDFKAIADWLRAEWNADVISDTSVQILFDLAKPVDLVEYEARFADRWDSYFEQRRDFLPSADVDAILAAGGHASMTDTEADAAFTDKLTL